MMKYLWEQDMVISSERVQKWLHSDALADLGMAW